MDRNFETGKHSVSTRLCSNPSCQTEYVVQHGGQKSGGSPVVHVPKVGEQPVGYCSTECLYEERGWNHSEFEVVYQSLTGVTPRKKGDLAPARRLENERR